MKECCENEKCALTGILQSVSMQEAALANIINGEAEKLNKALCMTNCIEELLKVNESVRETIQVISNLEASLKDKAVQAMEELNRLDK